MLPSPKYDISKVMVFFSGVAVHMAGAEEQEQQQNGDGEPAQPGAGTRGKWSMDRNACENASFDLVALGKAGLEGRSRRGGRY
jgi:hypothetical protein